MRLDDDVKIPGKSYKLPKGVFIVAAAQRCTSKRAIFFINFISNHRKVVKRFHVGFVYVARSGRDENSFRETQVPSGS